MYLLVENEKKTKSVKITENTKVTVKEFFEGIETIVDENLAAFDCFTVSYKSMADAIVYGNFSVELYTDVHCRLVDRNNRLDIFFKDIKSVWIPNDLNIQVEMKQGIRFGLHFKNKSVITYFI